MDKTRSASQGPSSVHRFWTALRAGVQAGADGGLRREISPFNVALAGVAPGDDAVTREIRAMLRA